MPKHKEEKDREEGEFLPVLEPRVTYCDRGFIAYTQNGESFRFALVSGDAITNVFALHPKHAKRFYLRLQEKIEEYEAKFGELEAELPK